MKVVILAGGFGTRLSEETVNRPKPMVEVGGRPILWHIMKIYAHYGFNEFVAALGYRADMIKQYFLDYSKLNGNFSITFKGEEEQITRYEKDDWTVHLIDTGYNSGTGGRIKLLKDFLGNEPFMLTYGDGVSNIPVDKVLEFHKSHGKMVTLSAVRPPAKFGGLFINEESQITSFTEKPQTGEGWINGGYMVCQPEVIDYIPSTTASFESDALEAVARDGQLMAYQHDGFWQCMDAKRDQTYLEGLWSAGKAPWKVWE